MAFVMDDGRMFSMPPHESGFHRGTSSFIDEKDIHRFFGSPCGLDCTARIMGAVDKIFLQAI